MGDNRDDSADSRYFGLLPRDHVVGTPLFVFWSYEDDADDFENKIKTIKESYFPNQTKQDENVEQESDVSSDGEEVSEPKLNNIMEAYSKAIARK